MKYISFVLILINFLTHAETSLKDQVSSLLTEADNEILNANRIKAYKIAFNASLLAEKNNNSKEKASTYVAIAKIIHVIKNSENLSFTYLKKAELEPSFISSPNLQSQACWIRGNLYFSRVMPDLAIREYQSQLVFAKQIEDAEDRALAMVIAYANICGFFADKKEYKLAWDYLNMLETTLKKIPEEKAFEWYINFYIHRADLYINQKEYIRAQSDLDRADYLAKKYNNRKKILNALLLKHGDLEHAKGNKEKALAYFKQRLENDIKEQNRISQSFMYEFIGNYIMENKLNEKEADLYFDKHREIQKYFKAEDGQFYEMVLKDIANKKDFEYQKKSSARIYIFLAVFLSLLIGTIFWYIQNKKLAYQTQKSLKEMNETAIELEKRVEENKFGELIILAKGNNPEFLILFAELYPKFIDRLKSIDPKIRNSELSFCALAYLNFSTKDISNYTHVTLGAVEMRRNRLRKKYNISSDIDFNSWMRDLEKTNSDTIN